MNADLQKVAGGIETQYQIELKALQARYEQKREAIRILAEEETHSKQGNGISASHNTPPLANEAGPALSPEWTKTSNVSKAVRQGLETLSGEFTREDIKKAAQPFCSKITYNRLGAAIFQLKKKGKIEILQKGTGQIPAKYRKK